MASSSGRICDHRAFYTMCVVRQEYSEGPGNKDLRFAPLSPTAAPMTVYQYSICASSSSDPLKVVRLPLNVVRPPPILEIPNPGIAESPLTVSISSIDLV
jgi:hypothetical protein